MFVEQFEELKHTGKLPTPSGVGLRVLMLTRSEECSLDEIAATLQADPALTGRVLKLANSVLTSGSQPATTARDAAVRLGLRTVCNVALGFSLISDNRTGRCSAFDYDGYWSWSLANAVAAQRLSREVSLGSPGEAFTLGLLARIGRLALASVHPAEYARLLLRLKSDRTLDLAHAEREAFCIQHREVAAAIAEDWGLPVLFSEVCLYFGVRVPEVLEWPDSRDYLRLLAATSRLADVLASEPGQAAALWPAAREALVGLGIGTADGQRMYDEIGDEWREWGQLLHVPAHFHARSDEIEASARALAAAASQGSGLRILAVDDDPASLRITAALLRREGHTVTMAKNGSEALALALQQPPQMVVTDWMMPEMDGLELCKRLRSNEAGRDLYILILTGRAEEERVVEAYEAGADDYLVKPVSAKMLLARIRPGLRVIKLQEDLMSEVQEKKDANALLSIEKRKYRVASMTDALTELPNRRGALKHMEKEWAKSDRSGLPLSLIMVDIDHFKQVNDQHGHDVGDEVLRATSRAIVRALRASDTPARMGGEEFIVLCPSTGLEGAAQLAERVRAAVEGNRIEFSTYQGNVTISLGVACRSPQVDSIDALLKAADEAVYTAKRLGRNRVASALLEKKKSA